MGVFWFTDTHILNLCKICSDSQHTGSTPKDPAMAISGLVITTTTDAEREALATLLASDPRFTLGPAIRNRQTAVLETPDPPEAPGSLDEDVCRWLWTQPGVVLVDVAAIHLLPESAP